VRPVTAYRPKVRRDPQVTHLFWQGVYYGIVVGLLAGAGLWGFLLLGGAGPALAADRGRTLLTLVSCGVFGGGLICVWVWGYQALLLTGPEIVATFGDRLGSLVGLFFRDEEVEDRELRVAAASQDLARGLLALPAGLPLMVVLGFRGKLAQLATLPLGLLSGLSAVAWVLLIAAGWQWLLFVKPKEPPKPPVPSPQERLDTARQEAEMDSALQLAVAKAHRARAAGDPDKAIKILEEALRDADLQGRSVAHLQLHRLLGWLYAKQGNVDGAMVMFQTVTRLAPPDSPEMQEAQAALERLTRKAEAASGVSSAPVPTKVLDQDAEPAGASNSASGAAPLSPEQGRSIEPQKKGR
jgi:hypothetical protein